MKIITIKNVFKTYPNGVGAIYDLNLDIEKGEFVFIIGGSGSGKSTLIKMLYREEKPTRGEIILGGVNVGSSQINILGLLTIARAIATLCCSPPDNLSG